MRYGGGGGGGTLSSDGPKYGVASGYGVLDAYPVGEGAGGTSYEEVG